METRWGPSAPWSVLRDTYYWSLSTGGQPGWENETGLSRKELEMFHLVENGARGTVGPIFPHGKGEGGEEGAHPPPETSGHRLGPLANCPQDNNFPSAENSPKTERPREECSQEGSVSLQVRVRGPAFHISSDTGTQGPFRALARWPIIPRPLRARA